LQELRRYVSTALLAEAGRDLDLTRSEKTRSHGLKLLGSRFNHDYTTLRLKALSLPRQGRRPFLLEAAGLGIRRVWRNDHGQI